MWAGISGRPARSVRTKTTPESMGAGLKVSVVWLPVCSPTPEIETDGLIVRWVLFILPRRKVFWRNLARAEFRGVPRLGDLKRTQVLLYGENGEKRAKGKLIPAGGGRPF